ncbi:MAG: PQQ-binding-like beta-propeller repeat protein, partial [Telluria sp.]
MMRITQKLVGIGMLVLMAGCSTLSSLNPFGSKSKGNPPAPLVELKGSMAVRTAWKLDMGRANNYVFTPAIVGNTVVLAGAGGSLARVDAASGRQLWRIATGTGLTAGVGSDGKLIAVGGTKGQVLAFDMDGKSLWKAQASSEVLSSPLVAEGVVVVRSIDNRIVALDAATGKQKWL